MYTSVRAAGFSDDEKNKAIEEFLPKIKMWVLRAKSTLPESVDYDELYSAASLGLVECLDKFDKSRNVAFSTYVEHRVKGAILDALRGMDFLSRNARGKVKLLEAAVVNLSRQLGREPNVEELSLHLGIEESEIYKIHDLQQAEKHISLDAGIGDDGDLNLIDFLKCNGLTPEDEAIRQNTVNVLAEEIDRLQQREKLVISLYYYEELTMKEIAQVLDITESRVSQIHSAAVQKLKKRLKGLI